MNAGPRIAISHDIRYVLFDLDGTLTDSAPGILSSLRYALEKGGVEVEEGKDLRVFLGPPLRESFPKYFGVPQGEVETLIRYYRERFEKRGMFENSVYPGVKQMLIRLKRVGVKMILATAKPEVYAKRIIEHFGLIDYFDFISGTSFDHSRDSKAAVIKRALVENRIDVNQAVMVGDRHHDVSGANENHIPCVGVLYGYGSEKELVKAGATAVVKTPEELTKYLLSAGKGELLADEKTRF